MTLEGLLGAIGSVLLLGGCALATIGLIGLILKPDIFEQLHVAGLITGPGVVLVLVGSLGTGRAEIITSAALVVAFVIVTAPMSTHLIAHAAVRRYSGGPRGRDRRRGGALVVPDAVGAVPEAGPEADRSRRGMRVVVAHDGTPRSNVATDLAASIGWPAGTHIRIVGAVAAAQLPPIDSWAGRDASPRGDEQASETPTEAPAAEEGPQPHRGALEAAADAIRRDGIDVETAVLRGDAADAIVEETASFDADLLVTGPRQRTFVQSLLGWSASGEIVDRAPCPVLVARASALRSAILTTDGSPASAAAVELVATWPIFDLVPVTVVSVIGDPEAAEETKTREVATDARRTIDASAAPLMDAGREVDRALLRGKPAAAVADAARARGADLIVIGSRGRTGLGRTLLGSVAGEILAAAECSVLVVGPPRRRPS